MNLDASDFKALGVSDKNTSLYLSWFNVYLGDFEINTPNRLISFFSNLLHESNNFNNVIELASGEAYEGNKNLGNTQKGDGVKFKGRGLGQITGRWNYDAFTKWVKNKYNADVDFIKNPEKLTEPRWAVLSAFWYWDFKKLAVHADQGKFANVASIWNTGKPNSKIINGLRDRVDKEGIVKNWLSTLVNKYII